MPMSGSCLRNNRCPQRPATGFTLLEILIVLALVAMVAALAAPRLQQTYDAVARSGERAEVARQLARLPVIARMQGQAIHATGGGPDGLEPYLDLPGGWAVRPEGDLLVEATGVCHPARVQVEVDGTTETWSLSAPLCEVSDAP